MYYCNTICYKTFLQAKMTILKTTDESSVNGWLKLRDISAILTGKDLSGMPVHIKNEAYKAEI